MSWCDKLASTPGLGVKLDKSYAPAASLLEPLAPTVSKWVDKDTDKQAFTVDAEDLFSFSLTTFDGYQFAAGPEVLYVEFKHRMRLRPQSAGPPIAEMLSRALPYTELLPQVTTRLLDLVRLVTTAKPQRKLIRLGVVSTTLVALEEAPPGILRFLRHVAKPWNDSPKYFNIEVTAKLPKVKGTVDYDRCIHLIQRVETSDNDLLTIRLDWQRYLDADKNLSMTTLPDLLENAQKDALAYFEDVGQGARFDD